MTDGWELLEERRARVLAGQPAVEPDTGPRFRRIERADGAAVIVESPPKRTAPPRAPRPKPPRDPRTAVVQAVQRGVRSGDPSRIVTNVAQLILDELARRIR